MVGLLVKPRVEPHGGVGLHATRRRVLDPAAGAGA